MRQNCGIFYYYIKMGNSYKNIRFSSLGMLTYHNYNHITLFKSLSHDSCKVTVNFVEWKNKIDGGFMMVPIIYK